MDDIIAYLVGRGIKDPDTVKLLRSVRFRLVRSDENYLCVTHDLKLDRINLETDKGIITKAYIG